MSAVVQQLHDELAAAAVPLGGLLGTDILHMLTARISDRADRIAAHLDNGDTDTALDVLGVLHPGQVPAPWWRTPLGRAVAVAGGMPGPVSQAHAARILGVSRARVHALTSERKLRLVAGGVDAASIAARL